MAFGLAPRALGWSGSARSGADSGEGGNGVSGGKSKRRRVEGSGDCELEGAAAMISNTDTTEQDDMKKAAARTKGPSADNSSPNVGLKSHSVGKKSEVSHDVVLPASTAGSPDCSTRAKLPVLPSDLLTEIFSILHELDVRRARSVCRAWQNAAHPPSSLLVVTASGSNELHLIDSRQGRLVQTVKACPPLRRHRRRSGSLTTESRRRRRPYSWPTCTAFGPNHDLFVSQYKSQGVLQFTRCVDGYRYRRTIKSSSQLEAPEGVVAAHGSLYVASAYHGTVTRISHAGTIMDVAHGVAGLESETLWGMCASPDGRALFIAAHTDDQQNAYYHTPTRTDSGDILRLDLEDDGSFASNSVNSVTGNREAIGYYPAQPFRGLLNRPCNPVFCPHGVLHVSSFLSANQVSSFMPSLHETGKKRLIHRFVMTTRPTWMVSSHTQYRYYHRHRFCHIGWLCPSNKDDEALFQEPWGLAFSESGEGYATCSTDAGPSLVKFESCGCISEPGSKQLSFDVTSALPRPGPVPCGRVTPLVGPGELDQANFVSPCS